MAVLTVHQAGPNSALQDLGREGYLRYGLARGGAMDRRAVLEAAALLGGGLSTAVIETPTGLSISVSTPQRVALTGAPMKASIDGRALEWQASHLLMPGETLAVRPTGAGVYGYIAFGGGIDEPRLLGSQAAHFGARIGRALMAGDTLELGEDGNIGAPPLRLKPNARFGGGALRMIKGPQTGHYSAETFERLTQTRFTKSGEANRQAARLEHDGESYDADNPLGVVSEVVIPGDIQMSGKGEPYVLMAECQTIGGYPRIGAVLEEDMPIVAQAPPGTELWFDVITLEQADALYTPENALLRKIRDACEPMVRSPHDIANLLSYQLISGATTGHEE